MNAEAMIGSPDTHTSFTGAPPKGIQVLELIMLDLATGLWRRRAR